MSQRSLFASLEEHFWYYVYRDETPDACWPWQGNITNDGYGRLKHEGKRWAAHRLAWTLANGPIPAGLHACHRCDNRSCVRNDGARGHVFVGTHQDNMHDRNRKGRQARGLRSGARRHPACILRGKWHPRTTLPDEERARIRQRYAEGGITQTVLAMQYGVTQTLISRIVRRTDQRMAPPPPPRIVPPLLTAGNHAQRSTKERPSSRVPRICLECDTAFLVHNYRAETANYCSRSCQSRAMAKRRWTVSHALHPSYITK